VRSRAPVPPGLGTFVIDVSDWPDINQLLLAADMLVTDYSSSIFEYALLGRPIVHYVPDIAAYEAERGFYIDLASGLPGPAFTTTTPLASHIAAGQFDLERVRAFAATWFEIADGHASERFIEWVVAPALRGERPRQIPS
jgi:CDP-ribitol ribitolphosphotransferase